MKNFNWYLVLLFISLPFFAIGNVIGVDATTGDGGGDGGPLSNSIVAISLDIYLNKPNDYQIGLEDNQDETFSFPSNIPPLFLLVEDVTSGFMITEIPLSNSTYNRQYLEDERCFAYENSFPISSTKFKNYIAYICANGQHESQTLQGHISFTIKEYVNGQYQVPQNTFNKIALGIMPKKDACTQYREINASFQIYCGDSQLTGDDPIESDERAEHLGGESNDNSNYAEGENNKLIDNLFPNPFSNKLEISLTDSEIEGQVQIFGINGKLMYEEDLSNTDKLSLSTDNWEKGFYLIKINSNVNSEIRKVLKF